MERLTFRNIFGHFKGERIYVHKHEIPLLIKPLNDNSMYHLLLLNTVEHNNICLLLSNVIDQHICSLLLNIIDLVPFTIIDIFPRDPITLSDDDWGVQSPPKRKVFRFHETILRR